MDASPNLWLETTKTVFLRSGRDCRENQNHIHPLILLLTMIEVRCNSTALLCYFTINQSSSKAFFIAESAPNVWTLQALEGTTVIYVKITCGRGVGSYFPYILLNEIQTMFSQISLASVPLTKKPEDSVYQNVNAFKKRKKKREGRRRDDLAILFWQLAIFFLFYAFFILSLFREWFSFSFEQFSCAGFRIYSI